MKQSSLLLSILIIIAFSFTSCTYTKVAEVVPVNDSGVVMSANALGVSYIAYDGSNSLGNNYLLLRASTKNNRVIEITVNNYTGKPGVYSLSKYSHDSNSAFYFSDKSEHNSLFGTLNLTEIAPYFRGTFYFICTDSTIVDSGYFKIRAN